MHCLMKVQHLLTQQTLKNVEHDRQLAPPLVLNEGNAGELTSCNVELTQYSRIYCMKKRHRICAHLQIMIGKLTGHIVQLYCETHISIASCTEVYGALSA